MKKNKPRFKIYFYSDPYDNHGFIVPLDLDARELINGYLWSEF